MGNQNKITTLIDHQPKILKTGKKSKGQPNQAPRDMVVKKTLRKPKNRDRHYIMRTNGEPGRENGRTLIKDQSSQVKRGTGFFCGRPNHSQKTGSRPWRRMKIQTHRMKREDQTSWLDKRNYISDRGSKQSTRNGFCRRTLMEYVISRGGKWQNSVLAVVCWANISKKAGD